MEQEAAAHTCAVWSFDTKIRQMAVSGESVYGQSTPGPAGGRCVVLVSPGWHAPTVLLQRLDQRGVRALVVEVPAQVMVELSQGQVHAVVINEPQGVPHLNELLGAVRTYYPQVACWRYEACGPNGRPQLSKVPAGFVDKRPLVTGEELKMLLEPARADEGRTAKVSAREKRT